MGAKTLVERPDEVGRSEPGSKPEVAIQIIERDGRQFLVLKETPPAGQEPASERTVEIPVALLPELKRAMAEIEEIADENSEPEDAPGNFQGVAFAHASEEEFARILDFYHIAWQYEPRSFPIEWDGEGNVVKSFTPDFYLPEHDLFIEITTLKQSLVTKKNRKVRLLKELYPEVNIKVLYASDYRKLIEKFAGSGALHGSENEKEGEKKNPE
ncbi:MAG TPA: hypothetical protein VNO70_20015 [Blastocatellia bacterium]|nr:hypothetical protein [Blastocatellia bacterium]